MSNDYYERKAELEPFTTARSDDVRNELDAVQSAFEKLAKPRQDGTTGFLTPFTIVTPTNPNEPATHAQVTAEKDKNTEQDGRLDNVENALTGLGPVDGRFTTLRYVASEGQTQIVLPAQFQSLAYVHKNGARLYQTVGFDYDVATKTITFANSLALSDEVLVDVGMVPDAVLADLISIQNDIANRHSDINTKHQDVKNKHQSVSTMHGDVDTWKQQVSQDKNTTVAAKDEANATYALLQKRHLGSHATPPTTDNDGNPLTEGASYYNNTNGQSFVYEQGTWVVTNLSETTTTSKTSLTGATVLPAGPTADRPDPAQLTQNQAYIRANTDLDEFEGIIVGQTEWGSIGGGGVTKPTTPALNAYPYTAKKGENIQVDLSDDVSKEVVVSAGLIVGNAVTVSPVKWTGNKGVTVSINPDNSYEWDHPLLDLAPGARCVIGGNSSVTIQLTAEGKLKMVQSQIDQRTVKRGTTVLWNEFKAGGVGDSPLNGKLSDYDDFRILIRGTIGGRKHYFSATFSWSDLVSSELIRLNVAAYSSSASETDAFVAGWVDVTDTTFNTLGLTAGTSWSEIGVYKIVGIKD